MKLTDIINEFSTPRIVPSTYLVGDVVSQEEFALFPGTRMYTTKNGGEGAKTIDGAIWKMNSMRGKWRKIKNGPVSAIKEDRSEMPKEYPNFDRAILNDVYFGLVKLLKNDIGNYIRKITNFAKELSDEYGNFDKLGPTRKNEYKRDCALLKRVVTTTRKQLDRISEFLNSYIAKSNTTDDILLWDLEEQLEDVIGSK